jgi:thiamine-monophosphate kinase
MFDKTNLTELSELGEFGLIKHLSENFKIHHPSSVKGIGDDAAVIKNNDKLTVMTTDMLLEGVHFDLSYMPLKHLGYKAVVVNISDVYAMNAIPKQITVSIGVSSKFSLEAIEDIYEGIYIACHKYGVDLVGGDTSSSKQGLILSITALGEVSENDIVYRNGAKTGDLLCVSGDLGGAYVGYQLLEREKRVFIDNPTVQPDLEGHDYIVGRQLKPEARKDIVDLLHVLNVKPTAMIDISDGLASEIFHICTQSGVGLSLYEDKIPIDPTTYQVAREFDLDPTLCALSGGEDYELLFTINASDFDKIKGNPDISVIGHCTAKNEGLNLITKGGNSHPLKAQGWDAFSSY